MFNGLLGQNYDQNIHFIGFSLGTGVNRWPVDMVHMNGWSPQRTHVTIMDSAEIGALSRHVQPIPHEALYIDNYITAFGGLHEKARNVILTQGAPILPTDILDYVDFHGYATQWYDMTIKNPISSYMGFFWSFAHGGLSNAPAEKSCFAQTASPWDDEGELDLISWNDARGRLVGRSIVQIGQGAAVVLAGIKAPLVMLGDVILDTAEEKLTAKLKATVSGQSSELAGDIVVLSQNESDSSSYLWIPLVIPQGSDLMSFDYCFTNCSEGDYVTVSIGERQVFIMEARFAEDGVYANSSYIDISGLSGHRVEILIAFNCDQGSQGELDVTNFQFHSTAIPADLNQDGLVNFAALSLLAMQWGNSDCDEENNWCDWCDLDRSGSVDIHDFAAIVRHWLRDSGNPDTW